MKVTIHTEDRVFDDLKPAWNELVQRSVANTPFNTWEWHTAWWAAYHPGDLWVVSIHSDDDHLMAIAPWFVEKTPDSRVLRFIGHIDVTDYMDLIVDNEKRESIYRCLAEFLAQDGHPFDQIGLANIKEDSPTYSEFAQALKIIGFEVDFELNEVAPLIHLPATYDAYLNDILDSKQRKEVNRKIRKAEAGVYDVQWHIVDQDENITEALERFLHLMRLADTVKAEFLKNEQHIDFFNRMIPLMHKAGWLQLIFIQIDGKDCAAYFNFDYGNIIYVYNSGLEPDKYGALGPGIILLQYTIQHAIEQQREVFDFLRGNETYKYRMGATDTHIYQLNAKQKLS